MPVVTFHHQHRSIEVEPNTNLRQLMQRVGVPPYQGLDMLLNCHGNNFCGTCAVEVLNGKGASQRGQDEEATLIGNLAIARVVDKNMRLSCQTYVTGDMIVKTQPARPLDKVKTKERFALLGLFSVFLLAFLGVMAYLVLDMIKLY
ncbi:MAG: 2Fe-2S iron-sulfur cluster-binding protein [Bacteroidota bacterium]